MAKGAFIGVPTIIPASTPLGNKAVGDIVKLNVGGVAVDFIVVQQGNPNATLYDASCDGTWLLMKDVYVVKAWDSTDNDYANSDAHAYLNGDFLGLFDSNIQSVIKQVKIPYRAGAGGDNTVTSGANGLSAKAFLLSSAETNFNLGTNQPNEGVTLSYFVGCANGADSKRIAYYNGAKYGWWFRSPYRGNNNQAIYVYYDNGSYNLANVSTANGIGLRPALILPTTLGVEEDGTVLSTPASSGDETPVEVAREVKQMFVGVEKKVGSLKYLDYIESSGTQYIDTGVNPNQDTRVVISAKFNTQPNTDSAIFGIRNSNTMQFWCYWRNSDAKYAFRFGSSSTNNLVAATSTEQNTIDANKNVLTIGANSATAAAATFTATYSMYLFAVNNAGSMQYPASVKIYSCQIYDNGALVRDFVPCENESGEVGMYDKLNNVFYANDGTGVFTAGSVVEEIGGTITSIARKVKKAWIGVNGVARLFFGIGMPLSELPVGALVSMNVNGAAKSFIKVHQGLPSSMYDSSCDGTWLLMQDIYETRNWDSGDNRYAVSDVHAYLNGDFLGLFDSKVQTVIKQVKIPYAKGSAGSNVVSGVNGLSAKIFFLSGYETNGNNINTNYSSSFPKDGACLSYFNGAAQSKLIAYLNGAATAWWTRSPVIGETYTAWGYANNGFPYAADGVVDSKAWGVRPAFILSSDALVNPTPNADGSYTLLV